MPTQVDQSLIENGTITPENLKQIKESLKSQAALSELVEKIGPKLSDQQLHDLNLKLIPLELETMRSGNSLLKPLLAYEAKRLGFPGERFLKKFDEIFKKTSATKNLLEIKINDSDLDQLFSLINLPTPIYALYHYHIKNNKPYNMVEDISYNLGDHIIFNILEPIVVAAYKSEDDKSRVQLLIGQMKGKKEKVKEFYEQHSANEFYLHDSYISKKASEVLKFKHDNVKLNAGVRDAIIFYREKYNPYGINFKRLENDLKAHEALKSKNMLHRFFSRFSYQGEPKIPEHLIKFVKEYVNNDGFNKQAVFDKMDEAKIKHNWKT